MNNHKNIVAVATKSCRNKYGYGKNIRNSKNWDKLYNQSKGGVKTKMGNVIDEAKKYVPKQTKNVAELDKLDITLAVFDGEGKDDKDETFKYKYVEVKGEKYRIPASVLEQIKELLKVKPDMKEVKVTSSGKGMGTKYQTIPL